MSDIAQDLGGVVRLLELATQEEWPEPEASRFVPDKFNVGDSAPYMLVGRDENDLRAAVAAVNFLRTHSAEIAGALRDAERYRWLRMMAKEQLLNPKAAGSEWPDMRTYWRIPTLICSGPVGGFIDFDTAIDSAMQQGGGGGE